MSTDKPAFSGKFTDRWVKHLRLPDKDDKPNQWSFLEKLGPGKKRSLALIVSYGGSKTWRVIWYVNGKSTSAKLGTYPDMSIEAARKAADAFDPKKEEAKKEAGTFMEVSEDFIRRYVEKKNLRTKGEIERQFRKYVFPKWKDRPLFDITRKEVNRLLDHIEDNHGARAADLVLATLSKMFNWYETIDHNFVSPIVRGMKRHDYSPRDRWLSNDEIRTVWAACMAKDEDGNPALHVYYSALIRLLLLTGQRRTKLASMRWDDIDLETGVWTIRREEREKATPDQLKLPDMALEIINSLPRIEGNEHVFAGRGDRHFNAFSQRKAELDELLPEDMEPWTQHDLRRTCRKLMTRRRVETEISERALGHSLKGIQAVYDDPREYGPRVNEALEAVASEITVILQGPDDGKIAHISQHRGKREAG